MMFPFASVVIGRDGEIRDVFPTCGLRPVGDSETAILFVDGGGPASWSGYFSGGPIVRDLARHEWLTGPMPDSLPRYVAGTIGDVKWAIVADPQRRVGYRISPGLTSFCDQCGGTTTSVDNVYAYDGGTFVVETNSGKRVLDMRALEGLEGEVVSFAHREDGAWRFVLVTSEDSEGASRVAHLVDENAAEIRRLTHPANSLSRDGKSILSASFEELVLSDADSGEARTIFDLRPLAEPLALPVDDPVWRDLLATFAIAELIPDEDAELLRTRVAGQMFMFDVEHQLLREAIATAKVAPKLSAIRSLPRRLS